MMEFIIDISEEQANHLQRLGYEVDNKVFVIDQIFSNHANDPDSKVIESVPFKHFMHLYETAFAEYEMAKNVFGNEFVRPIVQKKLGKEDVDFNWSIPDFLSKKCKVVIL